MELKHLIVNIFNDMKVSIKVSDQFLEWEISRMRNWSIIDERCLKVQWLILKFSYTNYYLELKICICK